ncbi:MAG: YdcF family protein [Nocardia sp.]|nr:YdcF family protein [Nocardia sp.]
MPAIRNTLRPTGIRLLATAALAIGTWGAVAAPAAQANPIPTIHGGNTAIVILGYGLLPDGRMRPELVDRLRTAVVQAAFSPASPIIATGGNPHAGVTEGDAMAHWLIAHGIGANRIHVESRAADTIQNARNSAALMRSMGITDAVVVTSSNHMPRAANDFVRAGVPVVGRISPQELPGLVLDLAGPRG